MVKIDIGIWWRILISILLHFSPSKLKVVVIDYTPMIELENQLQKINTKNKQIKKETDDRYAKLLEEAIAQMNEKFEILAEENDRLNDILSSSSEKS